MTETMTNNMPPIRMLVLTLTGRCNFACRYCYASDVDQVDMDEETAMKAVMMAGKSGERFLLQFSGGEPLLRFPLIRKLVHLVEEHHFDAQMQVQTNGSLLTKDIGRFLYDHNVGIGISCDGRPSVMDRTRLMKDGGSSSQAAARGFRNLAEEGIGTGITCVVTDDMVDELPGIADMAQFYGNVHQVGFDILREQGRGSTLHEPSAEAMTKALEAVYRRMALLEQVTGRHIHFTQEDRAERLDRTGKYEFPQCYAMNGEAAFVDVHGSIYACSSLMGRDRYLLGTVETGRDPDKVRKVGDFIKKAMNRCRSCEYFRLCGGGCFSRWLDKDGHVRLSEAECAMKKFFIKKYLEKKGTSPQPEL